MHGITGVVDVDGVASRTGAGRQFAEWSASRRVPEGMGLPVWLCSRKLRLSKRRVFEAGHIGRLPGVSGTLTLPACGHNGWQRIWFLPLVIPYQVKELAFL